MGMLETKYEKEVVPKLAQELGIKNRLALPKIRKVVVNMGVGEAIKNKESLEKAGSDLAIITGQKPTLRKAKVSVASFGLRRGMPVGLKVTLRRDRMFAFLEKLFFIVLPRLRDFRGLRTSSFDESGNYTLGISEHTVFPELDLSKIDKPRGLEVTIVTDAKNAETSMRLLELMGMPFAKEVSG